MGSRRFEHYYGSEARLQWVQETPCVVCGRVPSENAHTVAGGMGMKGPYWSIVPLCHTHHREQHTIGMKTFERKYGVNLRELARDMDDRWRMLNDPN